MKYDKKNKGTMKNADDIREKIRQILSPDDVIEAEGVNVEWLENSLDEIMKIITDTRNQTVDEVLKVFEIANNEHLPTK